YLFLAGAGGLWQEAQKLIASDGGAGQEFGSAVAFTGDTALIGALSANGHNTSSGAVYVFAPNSSSTSWSQSQKLFADDGVSGDQFGSTLAATADRLLIGAPGTGDKGSASGSVYFFTVNQAGGSVNASLTQTQKFTAQDGVSDDEFGQAIALGANIAAVG